MLFSSNAIQLVEHSFALEKTCIEGFLDQKNRDVVAHLIGDQTVLSQQEIAYLLIKRYLSLRGNRAAGYFFH
jgi:hypothetical protein